MEEQVMIRLSHGYFQGGVQTLPQLLPTIDAHIACWHVLIGEKMEEIKCKQVGILGGDKWDKMHDIAKRVYSADGIHTCGGGNLGSKILEEPIAYDEQNGYFRKDGTVGSLTTDGSSPKHNNRVVEPIVYDDYNGRIRADQSTVGTLTTTCGNDAPRNGVKLIEQNYRVRKLTERECFKLMGVKQEDFERLRKNQSKSSCYHLAGDSIVTTVLMAIFGQMFDINWKAKINEMVEEIIK